ncbi:MAG TPA: glucose-6-phosphate dehydrogenase [Atopostipes sp.]|jgi:glucose-6-phosphate 1-dehydrogenase|nr:glucose-6-phosphate dehydrogenase [Atopostipes sp.]
MSQNQKALFIIFGGTGDLAYRKLYPALYRLYKKNYLNNNFAVIGTARRKWTDSYYQEVVYDSIKDIQASEEDAKKFASHFRYQSHNVNDTDNYISLLNLANQLDEEYNIEGNRVFYLSVSPSFFGTVSSHLRAQNLISETGFNRLIIEKPFGTDFDNSNALNNDILESFTEEQIYRIDHYLGKEMIQMLLALRFGNPLLKRIWNKDFISNIQVTLAEDIGVGERGAYYEQSGALRDMVQNHVLQIVSFLYMDEPESNDSEAIRKVKVEALKGLKNIDQNNVTPNFVRGQYTLSKNYPDVLDYISEHEVAPDSQVETFVAGKIESEHDKWTGVPVYIRTGKRMENKNTQIDIVFKDDDTAFFPADEVKTNVLSIHIGPREGLSLQLNNKKIGHDFDVEPVELTYEQSADAPEDYERLILSALAGEKTNFVHWDELAESWKYIDSIREAWKASDSPLYLYEVNTNGPKEAFELLEKDGNYWIWD